MFINGVKDAQTSQNLISRIDRNSKMIRIVDFCGCQHKFQNTS